MQLVTEIDVNITTTHLYPASGILVFPKDTKEKYFTTATACSPCYHLACDTEVSAAAPPDFRAVYFLRL